MKSMKLGLGSIADAILSDVPKSLTDNMQIKLASDEFSTKLIAMVDELNKNHNEDSDLTRRVADIAIREGLSENEVDHLVRGINRKIFQRKFEKTKGQSDRTVSFKIADPYEVKAIMGLAPDVKEAAADNASGDSLEKVAGQKKALTMAEALESYDPESSHYVWGTTPAICTDAHREFILDKVAMNIQSDLDKSRIYETSIREGLDLLGACFVKYASQNLNHQEIFRKMCVDGDIKPYVQDAIVSSFDERKKQVKTARDKSIEVVDVNEFEDFSLGKYSISKIAESSVATLPEVVNRKRQINNFQRLVDLAVQIQNDDDLLSEINENIETKKRIIEDSNINEEMEGV